MQISIDRWGQDYGSLQNLNIGCYVYKISVINFDSQDNNRWRVVPAG